MEIMEDGNLMDKVLILIQRDMEYYKSKQTVLQETICAGIVGGRLDFPRSASFAAVKLVLWWEEEFLAAFHEPSGFLQDKIKDSGGRSSGGCGGIAKSSDPAKFVSLITKTGDQLLEHLHILTQEALDHADLTVLTGTIGAAALLKNCLWCYIQSQNDNKQMEIDELQASQKKYQEMAEALAERLLDLHCRLLSLYILQDADSLDWENKKAFCESERGSYVIQMWWLYMQGTKEDLWNTVPPIMAQRVFAGMLNESLTILTVRYMHAQPSQKRSQLYSCDVSNLLLCISQLLPSICDNSEELIGINLNTKSKILRDIHAKAQELFVCFLLRSAPLDIILKVLKRGDVNLLKSKPNTVSPWLLFTPLEPSRNLLIELKVLLSQPQPNWALLLKVLCMNECYVLKAILSISIDTKQTPIKTTTTSALTASKCEGFLCSGDGTCHGVDISSKHLTPQHYHNLIQSITFIVLTIGNESDFKRIILNTIIESGESFQCFDRTQVWNQKHPPWFTAITDLIKPFLKPIIDTVIGAVQTGASMYQACSIILISYMQLWECMNPFLFAIANNIQDLLPVTVQPMGKSVLLQILITALYSELLRQASKFEVFFEGGNLNETFDGSSSGVDSVALAIAEALCSIDEDNKHTEEIEDILKQASCSVFGKNEGCKRVEKHRRLLEVLASDLLLSDAGKKSLKVLHHFICNNDAWLLRKINKLPDLETIKPNNVNKGNNPLLHTMFYIGDAPFDQFLTGNMSPDWLSLMDQKMGLNVERISAQINSRWEFKTTDLGQNQEAVVNDILGVLKKLEENKSA